MVVGVDADREERVEIHQPHLDVLDAALAQRVQRPLARTDAPLGPDRAVELVFDLQHAVGELAVVVAVADADRRVGRDTAWSSLRAATPRSCPGCCSSPRSEDCASL